MNQTTISRINTILHFFFEKKIQQEIDAQVYDVLIINVVPHLLSELYHIFGKALWTVLV